MRPSLESLRVLEACIASGSFARAAERLFLTPAAISLRIRTLEIELGRPLFLRSGRRVIPTPEASILAERIRLALHEVSDALDQFRRTSVPLKLTAPPTFAVRWLAPRLARYPALVESSVDLDVSSELRDPGSFDVAVRTGRGGWPRLDEYRLFPVEATPMLAPSLLGTRALTGPEALVDFALLPHPDWQQWFEGAGCKAPRDLRFLNVDYPSHELDAHAAVAGAGVALLSPLLFRKLLEDGHLVAPFQHVLRGPLWHFALMRAGDGRVAPRQLCQWLCGQANKAI